MRSIPALLFAIIGALAAITGCATAKDVGPGMVVHFGDGLRGRSVDIVRVQTASGTPFSNPGSLSPSVKRPESGAVMGAAPDGRALPEWVEFTWREPDYPEDPKQTLEEYRALPQKTERVPIRARVPRDVVDEVIAARKGGGGGDKLLWLYLSWREDGIKLRWSLKQGCCDVLRAGGDKVD